MFVTQDKSPQSAFLLPKLAALAGLGMVLLGPNMAYSEDGETSESTGFDVQRLTPSPGARTNYYNVSSARILSPGQWDVGVLIHRDDDPLIVRSPEGERLGAIVDDQVTSHFMAAFGLGYRMELGIDLPYILSQHGETLSGMEELDGASAGLGLGDVRVVPKYAVFGAEAWRDGGLSISALGDIRLPTGREQSMQGDAGIRMEARVVGDYYMPSLARFSVNLGYQLRPEVEVVGIEIDDVVTWGVAAEVALRDTLEVVPEMSGQVPVASGGNGGRAPSELMVGVRYFLKDQVMVTGGLGVGLIAGFGTPDWRSFAGMSYAPFRRVDPDPDFDGLLGGADRCHFEPEDFDGFQDDDGCPEDDNDGDGILDVFDFAPDEAEDYDGYQDEDGVPDDDNDGDGVADNKDFAPDLPEDYDGFEDEDGVPDEDNDRDGLADTEDFCPGQPEVYNGYSDNDGCPDDGELVLVSCDSIELLDKIHFRPGTASLTSSSFETLDLVAIALKAAPFVGSIRIDGHTDSSEASAGQKMSLSTRRANSVRMYLIDAGVELTRIDVQGLSDEWPLADNSTGFGRSLNRRVELVVVDPISCQAVYDPDLWWYEDEEDEGYAETDPRCEEPGHGPTLPVVINH